MDVRVDCLCPPNAAGEVRHPDGDTVTLRDKLDLRASLGIRNVAILAREGDPDAANGEILAVLTEGYILAGVVAWSIVDAHGKPTEPTRAAIRETILARPDVGIVVADAADTLYMDTVLPLVVRASISSPATPTDGSTSPTNGSPPAPRKRSKRSSTTTSPTAAIETTSPSPAGASN